jgi:hypothetical protein
MRVWHLRASIRWRRLASLTPLLLAGDVIAFAIHFRVRAVLETVADIFSRGYGRGGRRDRGFDALRLRHVDGRGLERREFLVTERCAAEQKRVDDDFGSQSRRFASRPFASRVAPLILPRSVRFARWRCACRWRPCGYEFCAGERCIEGYGLGLLAPVPRGRDVEAQSIADLRPASAARKFGNVHEHFDAAVAGLAEPEAAVLIPFDQRALCSHCFASDAAQPALSSNR